ncbi:MAG: LysM peptidoglycan-binding domain-containing protein, partial [Proteobacteria bacterium]|nr:LysM peptidoglycan-binding domain-containing protein [Pseudomonadota bacterium]
MGARPRPAPALAATALALAVLVGGCGGERTRPEAAGYVVQPGDTLYAISWRHGLDYRDVARWNGIGADYRIAVGQHLSLTPPAGGRASAPPAAVPGASAAATAPATPAPHFTWPADGAPSGTVAMSSGGIGLRIAGTAGSPVRAAA